MAIAYCKVQMMSRAKGRCVVAAAAYRSGEKLENEREGNTYAYARKTDRIYTEILAPAHAPAWATNREHLWNEVERIEKRKDSQLAREIMIALPKELSQEQNIALARAYAQTFAHEGMVADLSIHDKGDGNPHAHIMLTTRPFNEDGTWGAKSKEDYILDAQGEKIKRSNGNYQSCKVDTTDWNRPEKLLEWRERYEHITNYHLEKAGSHERIDARSYERQGIDKTPTVHMGHYAHELEQQGIETKVGNINRQIQAENQQREALKQELDTTLAAIQEEQNRLKQGEEIKKQEALQREEVIRQHTISEEALQQKVAEWERMAQEHMGESSLQKNRAPTGWEALKAEAAKREEVIKQKTISEEAMQQRVTEWEKLAQEALKQHEPEPSGWEALKREAAKREASRENAEQEAVARREMERKFVRPHQLQHPARILRPKRRMRHVNWSMFAEGVKQARMQSGRLDWQKLAAQAEARRVDWQKLAKQQAGRVDWKQLAEQAEARRVDWKQLAERAEAGRTDWQKLADEARQRREGGVVGFGEAGEKKPLRDLYNTSDETYTEKQKEQDDKDKSK